MKKEQNVSTGLSFMQAAKAAMPKSLGDRERIAAMSDAMRLAIRNRFVFDKEDAAQLVRMGIETCVGVFRPLDFYLQACLHGGTYPKMWEAHHKQRPWMARNVVVPYWLMGGHRTTVRERGRVTERLGVLLPQTFAPHDPHTMDVDGMQVWWVTSMTDEAVNLCQYRQQITDFPKRDNEAPFKRPGHPFRIRKLTRTQWKELFADEPVPIEEKQAA